MADACTIDSIILLGGPCFGVKSGVKEDTIVPTRLLSLNQTKFRLETLMHRVQESAEN